VFFKKKEEKNKIAKKIFFEKMLSIVKVKGI